jgi:hypothetical protein
MQVTAPDLNREQPHFLFEPGLAAIPGKRSYQGDVHSSPGPFYA